jgi:hypothetical protein
MPGDHAIDTHRAGAAHAMFAAGACAGQAQSVTQEICQCGAGIDRFMNGFTIHGAGDAER